MFVLMFHPSFLSHISPILSKPPLSTLFSTIGWVPNARDNYKLFIWKIIDGHHLL